MDLVILSLAAALLNTSAIVLLYLRARRALVRFNNGIQVLGHGFVHLAEVIEDLHQRTNRIEQAVPFTPDQPEQPELPN